MMMQRLSLPMARTIVETTNKLLPLIYRCDTATKHAHTHQAGIATAQAAINSAMHDFAMADTQEGMDAATALLNKAKAELAHHQEHAKGAVTAAGAALQELKELTHDDAQHKRRAIQLPPRKLRREAARVVNKEVRRLERERRQRLGDAP
jgi:hypothetical protein